MARRKSNAQLQKEFSSKLKKLAEQLPREKTALALKKIGFEAVKRLIEKTPVDTGRARGGWHVTLNYPSSWVPPEGHVDNPQGSPTTKGRNTKGQFTGGVIRDPAGPTLSAAERVLARIPGYSVVYIQNNVEYIGALEDGHSKQAPQGMLRLTFEELLHMFRRL